MGRMNRLEPIVRRYAARKGTEMPAGSKYTAKKYRAPMNHEFVLVEAGLWRCKWCDSFVSSDRRPYPEAVALDEAKARGLMAPNRID